jgi:endoglycosylceramidase
MSSKLIQVAGNLLLSACNPSYIGKFFYKPKKGEYHYITDKTGRITIYHGANVSNSSKSAPDFLPWQTKEDFAKLKTWGFNLVRYIVLWEAVEPARGPGIQPQTYNTAYIQATLERLQWLKELGIDVIIDFHQDIYAKRFTGNGFPDWTLSALPCGCHYDDSIPFVCQNPWNMNYFQPAVVNAYNWFWTGIDLQDAYIKMLTYVMSQFDGLDNVIGFDVMNEPFLSTIHSFEKKVLTKFYTDIQTMMEYNNFKSEMCFEPEMYTSAVIPSNLKFVPSRDTIFMPHYYDAFCHQGSAYEPLNKTLMTRAIAIKQREAQKFGVPLIFGEFGISASVKNYDQYLRDFVRASNEGLFGFVYYAYDKKSVEDFGLINDDGTPTGQLDAILSVYPQKIAGKNPVVKCEEKSFTLDYETDPAVTGPTEIFFPENLKVCIFQINGKDVPYNSGLFLYNNDESKSQHIFFSWV